MKKYILLVLIFANQLFLFAQTPSPWTKISTNSTTTTAKSTDQNAERKLVLYQLDLTTFKQSLGSLTSKSSNNSTIVEIPNIEGKLERFTIWEDSNFDPALQEKYPEIKAFTGKGLTDKNSSINISLSPKGIQTIVLRTDNASEFIESYLEDPTKYSVFQGAKRESGALPLNCQTEDNTISKNSLSLSSKTNSSAKVFKTMRLALSCTAEYTTYHGGTVAGSLAAMNATLSRVNAVFNRDLAVKLVIIASNEQLIYTNATTDPYSNAANLDNWGLELQKTLTATIGNNAYDLGHVFGASGGGGNAGCIGCVCENPTNSNSFGKGSAYTSPGNGKPEGDTFDIDFVAHEFGHQLGANHTFSYDTEGTGVNIEPGSGSTIMGYAGVTGSYDVQDNSDDYFSFASISQIQSNLTTKSCPVSTTIANNPPTVNAGSDYTIPIGTAFTLKGTATDPEGDTLTYTWEQNDSASSGATEDNSLAVSTKTSGPLFRSLYPSTSPIRYMPALSNVLANKLTSNWESVSNVGRTLHFVLTARDNAAQGTAQTNSDETTVTVNGSAGPFIVTSQNTDDVSWLQGTNETITWDVKNTNTLPGSSTVNIKLSTDGGLTFGTTLAENISNNGTATILVPNITQKNCKIRVEPTNNIYYALNSKTFAIGYSVDYSCTTYTFNTPFAIPEKTDYTTRTITVPATETVVSDVNINANFTHTYLSDLQMDIISPTGTTVKLFERGCSDSRGTLALTFDDSGKELLCGQSTAQTVTPYENLSAFNNEAPQGTWTFRVRDAFPDDTGTLNSASMVLCTKSYSIRQPTFGLINVVTYENPNDGKFTLYLESDNLNPITLKIVNISGRTLFTKEYSKTFVLNEEIQIPSPQSGLYFLTITSGDKEEVRKILVK